MSVRHGGRRELHLLCALALDTVPLFSVEQPSDNIASTPPTLKLSHGCRTVATGPTFPSAARTAASVPPTRAFPPPPPGTARPSPGCRAWRLVVPPSPLCLISPPASPAGLRSPSLLREATLAAEIGCLSLPGGQDKISISQSINQPINQRAEAGRGINWLTELKCFLGAGSRGVVSFLRTSGSAPLPPAVAPPGRGRPAPAARQTFTYLRAGRSPRLQGRPCSLLTARPEHTERSPTNRCAHGGVGLGRGALSEVSDGVSRTAVARQRVGGGHRGRRRGRF